MNRSRYTYTTAIVIIPPDHCWEPIQTIRREHDEKVPRWMPHITMIYPFWPRNRFEEAAEKLLEVCGQIEPFELVLSRFDTFHHGRSKYTMWLDPELGEKLKKLHELLVTALEIPWGTGPLSTSVPAPSECRTNSRPCRTEPAPCRALGQVGTLTFPGGRTRSDLAGGTPRRRLPGCLHSEARPILGNSSRALCPRGCPHDPNPTYESAELPLRRMPLDAGPKRFSCPPSACSILSEQIRRTTRHDELQFNQDVWRPGTHGH
jgi:hypothetical protein